MSELEDKLNSLLSNQDAMAQVMQLAQSLSQSGVGAADSGSAASPPPPQSGAAAGNAMPSAGDLNAMLSQLTGGLDARAFIAAPAGAEPDESEREQRDLRAPLRAAALSARDKRRDKVGAGGAARQAHPSGQGISDDAGGVAVYNRYLRNDQGVYTCVPQEEPRRSTVAGAHRQPRAASPKGAAAGYASSPAERRRTGGRRRRASARAFRSSTSLLEKLHLQDLDGADLMLLLLLFFLFEEKADDELLIALGLLLIL